MGFTEIRILLEKPEQYEGYDYVISVTADKTQRLFGVVGESAGSYGLSRSLNLTQRFTGSADKLRMSGNIGYSMSKPVATESTSSTTASDYFLSDVEWSKTETNSYSGNISLSQDITEKQYLTGNLSISKNNNKNSKYGISEFHTKGLVDSLTNNNTFVDNASTSFSGNLAYHYDIKPSKQAFSMSYTVSTSPSENNQIQSRENQTSGSWNSSLRQSESSNYSHVLSVDYRDRLTPKLTLTGRTSLLIANNDRETRKYDTSTGTEIEDIDVYDYFKRPVRRIDGSLSLSWLASRNINITARVRPDYMLNTSKITMISGTDEPSYYAESNWAFNSALGVRITFPKKMLPANLTNMSRPAMPSPPNILNFNYSISQSRPNYRLLSNYIDDTNPNYLETGNPFLKNETTHALSLALGNSKLLNPSLSYRFSNDRITNYWYETPDNKTIRSYMNGGQYKYVSLALNKGFMKMNSQGSIMLMTSVAGSYMSEKVDGYSLERYGVNGMSVYSATIFKNYTLSGILMYIKYFTSGYSGSDFDPWHLDIRVDRKFALKNGMKLSLSAGTDNVFGWSRRTDTFVNSGSFRMDRSVISKRTPIFVSCSLNFGTFKVKPVKNAMSKGTQAGFSDGPKDESAPPKN